MTYATVFLFAFFANLVWEFWHSRFYIHYRGRPITRWVLLRAALFDAVVITILAVIFKNSFYLDERRILVFFVGVAFAVWLEYYALRTKRWAYNKKMPMLPFTKAGLTPSIQLGLLAYIIFFIVL